MSVITKQLETFANHLRAKNYSDRTISCYSSIIRQFLTHFKESPGRITSDEIVEWMASHDNGSTKAQIRGCLKNYYTHVVGQPRKFDRVPQPKREKKLPIIIDRQIILTRIDRIQNVKHKAIISILYGLGLRREELLNLKVRDINGSRMEVHVHLGKGNKDRILLISEKMLAILRSYYRSYRPVEYLFEGQHGGKYSPVSVAKICSKYLDINPHGLRHCNATHLLESGVDISEVSKRLGHSKLETTMIYNHVKRSSCEVALI